MPTNNVQDLLAQDISDPTDFPSADLRQLDASVRCSICGEFFDAPISLACGHCFCSLCIREHIVREPECPRCRKSAAEAHFRVDPVLEEVVSAWKTARSYVIRSSREDRPKVASKQNWNNDAMPYGFGTAVRNERKRRHSEVSQGSNSDVVCVAAGSSNSNKSSEIADRSPPQAKSAAKTPRQKNTEPSSDPQEVELMRPDSLVTCPLCGELVEYQIINSHMDGPSCNQKSEPRIDNSNPNAKVQWSRLLGNKSTKGKSRDNSILGDTTERLPKVSYDVLKDKALKDLLASQQLPMNGDRNTRIARHRRWVMVHNANLDKNIGRKTLSELRLELKAWEEGRKGPKHVVEDSSAHEALHKEEFSRLVEEARRRGSNCMSSNGGRRDT